MENENNIFSYSYSAAQQDEIKQIREKYQEKEVTGMDELRRLDQSVENAGTVPSIALCTIGLLLMGMGMCCSMVFKDFLFIPGIVIGTAGIAATALAYPLHNFLVQKRRKELAPQILKLTEELMRG